MVRGRVPTFGIRRQGHPLTPHPSPPPSDTGVSVEPGACVELQGPSPTLRTLHLGTGQEPRSSLCCLSCSSSPPLPARSGAEFAGTLRPGCSPINYYCFFLIPFAAKRAACQPNNSFSPLDSRQPLRRAWSRKVLGRRQPGPRPPQPSSPRSETTRTPPEPGSSDRVPLPEAGGAATPPGVLEGLGGTRCCSAPPGPAR